MFDLYIGERFIRSVGRKDFLKVTRWLAKCYSKPVSIKVSE